MWIILIFVRCWLMWVTHPFEGRKGHFYTASMSTRICTILCHLRLLGKIYFKCEESNVLRKKYDCNSIHYKNCFLDLITTLSNLPKKIDKLSTMFWSWRILDYLDRWLLYPLMLNLLRTRNCFSVDYVLKRKFYWNKLENPAITKA